MSWSSVVTVAWRVRRGWRLKQQHAVGRAWCRWQRRAKAPGLNAGCYELMVHGIRQAAELDPLLSRASVVVIGPGLGQDGWSRTAV